MDRDNVVLIALFLVVIIFSAFLLLYDPSNIGKSKENTSNNQEVVQPKPYIPPEQRPSGLVVTPNKTRREPEPEPTAPKISDFPIVPEPEPIIVPNQTEPTNVTNRTNPTILPENYTYIPPVVQQPQPIVPVTPKVELPKTSNKEEVCNTMCKFRDSTMERIDTSGSATLCVCKNGYERQI